MLPSDNVSMSVGHLDRVLIVIIIIIIIIIFIRSWQTATNYKNKLIDVYSSMEYVTWKSLGPMCGWVGRILHPDSCTSVSSWSKVPLLCIRSVAVPFCRPLLPCPSRWHASLPRHGLWWLTCEVSTLLIVPTEWISSKLRLHNVFDLSVCPSVRSSVTKHVNTILWKRVNRFWCQSGGQRSRSRVDARFRFRHRGFGQVSATAVSGTWFRYAAVPLSGPTLKRLRLCNMTGVSSAVHQWPYTDHHHHRFIRSSLKRPRRSRTAAASLVPHGSASSLKMTTIASFLMFLVPWIDQSLNHRFGFGFGRNSS